MTRGLPKLPNDPRLAKTPVPSRFLFSLPASACWGRSAGAGSGSKPPDQFGRAAPYRLRTATHRLPISSCGAAAKVAPHFHKAAVFTCWGHAHSRIAAYLHGIRSFRTVFRSTAVAVSLLVMHISATTVNDRIMGSLALLASRILHAWT